LDHLREAFTARPFTAGQFTAPLSSQHPSPIRRRDYSLDHLREAFIASPFTAGQFTAPLSSQHPSPIRRRDYSLDHLREAEEERVGMAADMMRLGAPRTPVTSPPLTPSHSVLELNVLTNTGGGGEGRSPGRPTNTGGGGERPRAATEFAPALAVVEEIPEGGFGGGYVDSPSEGPLSDHGACALPSMMMICSG